MINDDYKEFMEKMLPEDFYEAKELARVHIPTYQAIVSAQLSAVTALLLAKGIATDEEIVDWLKACYSEIRKQTITDLEKE